MATRNITGVITSSAVLFRTIVLATVAIVSACAPRVRQDAERAVVAEATVLSIEEVLPQSDVVDISDFDTGGWAKLRLRAERSLIGRTTERRFVAQMKLSAFPRSGSHIYVVGVESPDGTVLVDRWGWASEGICIDREFAKSVGIEAAVFQLRRERIVETNPGCDAEWEE